MFLYVLGLDRLKSALMALGLKCGGTLEERANRLFSTKGKALDDLDPSLQAKSKNKASTAYKNAKEFENVWYDQNVWTETSTLNIEIKDLEFH